MSGDLKVRTINVANIYDDNGNDVGPWEFLGASEIGSNAGYIESTNWYKNNWYPKYETIRVVGEKFEVVTDNQELLMQFIEPDGTLNTTANTYTGKYTLYNTTVINGALVTGNQKWSNGTFSLAANFANDLTARLHFTLDFYLWGRSSKFKLFNGFIQFTDQGGTDGMKYNRLHMGAYKDTPINGIRIWPRTVATTTNTNFDEGRLLIYGLRNSLNG